VYIPAKLRNGNGRRDILPKLFVDHRTGGNETDETLISELYQQIGKFKVELEWLKKGPVYRNRREW